MILMALFKRGAVHLVRTQQRGRGVPQKAYESVWGGGGVNFEKYVRKIQ